MTDAPRLSAIEADVLTAWDDVSVDHGFGFAVAAERCNTPRQQIRRAVRALARKGLLAHCRCLWDEDEGIPKGGGYTLTLLGSETLEASAAQGIEAGTATTGTGVVHESPVPEGDAPEPSQPTPRASMENET